MIKGERRGRGEGLPWWASGSSFHISVIQRGTGRAPRKVTAAAAVGL